MTKTTIVTIALISGFILILGLFHGALTGNVVKEEKTVITFPPVADFLHDDQGAVTFEFSFPSAGFRIGDKDADVLMFLDSQTVPGLKVGYNIGEKKIYAGLPLLVSNPVEIVDGKGHQVVYLFSKAEGKQAIFVDGQIVAEGGFTGKNLGTLPSGFAVYSGWREVESPYKIKAQFSD
ncbi:MAG: hypothetical protein Q7S65_05330 [Nanoarchaeota archaeon]|nr:hypothetical protein [Nanoarchaeota archaeon]